MKRNVARGAWTDNEDLLTALKAYHKLHDGLSDMIESGRLSEAAIPDDYSWLVESLAKLGAMAANQ